MYTIKFMEMYVQECVISDCGELAPGQDEGMSTDDKTGDNIPDWPEDCEIDFNNVCKYLIYSHHCNHIIFNVGDIHQKTCFWRFN